MNDYRVSAPDWHGCRINISMMDRANKTVSFLYFFVNIYLVFGVYLSPEELAVFNGSGLSLYANESAWWAEMDTDADTDVMAFPTNPTVLAVPECVPEGKSIIKHFGKRGFLYFCEKILLEWWFRNIKNIYILRSSTCISLSA